ncbi:allantoinase [Panus rudis PR-1116 ss-1]|nr:allantoinase [Panus rudis PR-1116 ss-1]
MGNERIFTGRNVLLPGSSTPVPALIKVDKSTGRIVEVQRGAVDKSHYPNVQDEDWIDAGDSYLLPGQVDAHVHLNEPGRTEWEGFYTGTRAAASGGVTTVVDMPLNSIPPTTTVENLELKRAAAKNQCWVDIAFWGGVIPGNQSHLKPLVDAGVRGFKCFLIESGVEEFPCVNENDLRSAMAELQGTSTVLCFHAELESHEHATATSGDPTRYQTFLDSRPEELEINAISLINKLHAQHPNLRLHIVHLSASSALPLLRAAKASGLPLTVETCYHYLTLASDYLPDGHPETKCCPPIRDEKNRNLLWDALKEGTIDFVVSDHSPCVAELKKLDTGDIMSAWGGISTLGLGLSLLWTEAKKRGVSVGEIVRWTSVATAKHAGLEGKGEIKVGNDADLVIFDPSATFKVTKDSLHFKNKVTPYENLTLTGRVQRTYLRGEVVYDLNTGFGLEPLGKLL